MKNTYRFFVAPGALAAELIEVSDSDLLHQWHSVLRLRPGQQIALLDGGPEGVIAELVSLSKRAASLQVVSRYPAGGEPRIQVWLYVALARGERFEWVLQKGTELGAHGFVPLYTEHTLTDRVSTAKTERWQRIIREAAEQSGRSQLPQLLPPQTLAQSLQQSSGGLFLSEGQATVALKQALQQLDPAQPLKLWSGPEGGWSSAEMAQAQQAQLTLTTLGPRILRAETAPVAALAALMYAYDEWQLDSL